MSELATVIGWGFMATSAVVAIAAMIGWASNFAWQRCSTAWKLALLNVLRRDAVKAEAKRRAKEAK